MLLCRLLLLILDAAVFASELFVLFVLFSPTFARTHACATRATATATASAAALSAHRDCRFTRVE
eukprot:6190221-Pleurochrysis_carterae.AAC.1